MPIQFPITQDTGVVVSYHVISSVLVDAEGKTASCNIKSYVDAAHATQALPSAVSQFSNFDTTSLLPMAPAAQGSYATTLSQLIGNIELYLLMTPTFSGGAQVA